MRIAMLVVSLVAITATATACGSRSKLATAVATAGRGDTTAFGPDAITVRVENQGFPEVTVYVVSEGGTRVRVGNARGHADTVLELPRGWVLPNSRVRFILDPLGGGRVEQSDEVIVSAGDEVRLIYNPAL